MGTFAKSLNGIVQQVIVADLEFFESFEDNSPGTWIQTSYNTRAGVHYGADGNPDGGVAMRKNYAGIGYTYDATRDAFIPPKPADVESTLDESTCTWVVVNNV
jgi:hypothetical protein